jgi:lysozyme family protein
MSDFDHAFTIVVGEEGGYVNNPKDPGGETKFGISKRSYPNLDIRNLTIEDAKGIYQRNYWAPLGCDKFPWLVSLPLFDCGINCGVTEALLLLHKAERSSATPTGIFVEFMTQQALFKANLKIFPTFGLGWFRRMFRITISACNKPPA